MARAEPSPKGNDSATRECRPGCEGLRLIGPQPQCREIAPSFLPAETQVAVDGVSTTYGGFDEAREAMGSDATRFAARIPKAVRYLGRVSSELQRAAVETYGLHARRRARSEVRATRPQGAKVAEILERSHVTLWPSRSVPGPVPPLPDARWQSARQMQAALRATGSDLLFPAVNGKFRSPSVLNKPLEAVALELGLKKTITQRLYGGRSTTSPEPPR